MGAGIMAAHEKFDDLDAHSPRVQRGRRCHSVTPGDGNAASVEKVIAKARKSATRHPIMPSEITMPQQSDTMTEDGQSGQARGQGQGRRRQADETDKVITEMEAFESGTIAGSGASRIESPGGTIAVLGNRIRR
jgi:hypothetical protein